MTFENIFNQFIKPTIENFPIDVCVIQNKRESNVFDSDTPFLCLVIDKRFDYYWQIVILYPYIYKESDTKTTFGWVDRSGNIYCNINNSTQLWDEFVIGFQKYEENGYKEMRNSFLDQIEEQYND